MDYEHINEDEVRKNVLTMQARDAEQRAVTAEFEYERALALAGAGDNRFVLLVDPAETNMRTARREADAFKKASDIDKKELEDLRRNFLINVITSLEQQHVSAVAVREVRKDLGLPTSDYDSNMLDLEESKTVADKMLAKLPKPADPEATARTNGGKTGRASKKS